MRTRKVREYRDKFLAGEMVQDTLANAISFGDDGILLNGQHRLAAIAQIEDARFRWQFWITTGEPKGSLRAYDNTVARSARDRAVLTDRPVGAHRSYITILRQIARGRFYKTTMPMIDAVEDAMFEKYRESIDFAIEHCRRKPGSTAMFRAIVARAHYHFAHARRARDRKLYLLEHFCTVVAGGRRDPDLDVSPALSLGEYLNGKASAATAKELYELRYFVIEKAIMNFVAQRNVTKTQGPKKGTNVPERFPLPTDDVTETADLLEVLGAHDVLDYLTR